MNFIASQMAYFMAQQTNRRNLRFVRRLLAVIGILLALYTGLFHYIMQQEGHNHSLFTGFYWSLTVMSTLGFGDITFSSDMGRIFTMVVLLSGIILFMLIMPFTFIRFIYIPWIEAQNSARTPRTLPKTMEKHVLIVGTDDIALGVADALHQHDIPYCILTGDQTAALALYERKYKVMLGDIEMPETYLAAQVQNAELVIAMQDDFKNTNISSTIREVAPSPIIAATADNETAKDILLLAGCNHVFCFPQMLGISMAKRVHDREQATNIIGRFEGLCIAEMPVRDSSLAGQRIKDIHIRRHFGLNIAGLWQASRYAPVLPTYILEEKDTLLITGTADDLERFDASMATKKEQQPPVIILGGGRVGQAIAQGLITRGIDFRLVDKNPKLIDPNDHRYILGDASSRSILKQSGIDAATTVLVTTHNDDVNIYLSIFCRKLRPDIQIIGRVTLDRNISSLYSAGASLVMSHASLTANTIINLLHPEHVFTLTEGLNIFKVVAPTSLVGSTLQNSGIREKCDCNVVAVSRKGELHIPPSPLLTIDAEDELVIIGTEKDEGAFRSEFLGSAPLPVKELPKSPTNNTSDLSQGGIT